MNAQQYPKAVTGIVVPRPGYIFIDADFSQIEYRTLVAMADEPALKEQFYDPDIDYHTMMAALMYGVPYASVTPKMRGDAKSFNFGIPYGMGFGSLAILLTGKNTEETREEAKEKYELYFKDQPKVKQFFIDIKEAAQVYKYTETKWGRRRYYSFVDADGKVNNARRAAALRQAGNAVIQGTAADIFKMAVARNFSYIRKEGLLGDILITNMVHDELLFEINCEKLNVQRALRDIVINMQMEIEGFPPLFVGAGVGLSWSNAKGKMAEIHPHLASELSTEVDNTDIRTGIKTVKDNLKYFDSRVLDFRTRKILDYIQNEENHNKVIHPVIGNLLGLQFDYGVEKEYQEIKESLSKIEQEEMLANIPKKQLEKFMSAHGVTLSISLFDTGHKASEEEIEDDYDEIEDGDEDAVFTEEEIYYGDFALIDEDPTILGVSMQEMIKQFGLMVSSLHKICGIDITQVPLSKKEELFEYLADHVCEYEEEGSMEIVFLMENNILKHTYKYVKGISGSELNTRLKLNSLLHR